MVQLNFARKWRSKNFNELVGQELSVRILKNTLYLNHFFPVYLFSGQRGCGKTSTARIFASAINCEQLEAFRKNPRAQSIPCLACGSCLAMKSGNHPDFIEMDAASHTGVDNVRQLIDASSLMPVLGGKKIYLIDEAHMLSKAAFNAFLKILEEPPERVLFILATTELHKIIDTVKSRSFQLFFNPVEHDALLKHLIFVCEQESIGFEEAGLSLIINETEGSVRDALNLLEQVRFSAGKVTKDAVLRVLVHCDDSLVISLVEAIVRKDDTQLITLLNDPKIKQCKPETLWQSLLALFSALIAVHYGLTPEEFGEYAQRLKELAGGLSIPRITAMLSLMHSHELLMAKTRNGHAILQTLLLRMMNASSVSEQPHKQVEKKKELASKVPSTPRPKPNQDFVEFWQKCLNELANMDDPLMYSVFKQASCQSFSSQTGELKISFAKKFSFFGETLENSTQAWQPILNAVAGIQVKLKFEFVGENEMPAKEAAQPIKIQRPVYKQSTQQQGYSKGGFQRRTPAQNRPAEIAVDVSDEEAWPKANKLLSVFPGVITEVKE
jgi:DNA polymerase-3 subunit gamma/tau